MQTWLIQIFLGTTIVLAVGWYLVLNNMNNPSNHYVATLKNTSLEPFALHTIFVRPIQVPRETRSVLRTSLLSDVRKSCSFQNSEREYWKSDQILAPGDTATYAWDGLWTDCQPVPEGRYELLALEFQPKGSIRKLRAELRVENR